MCGGGDRVVGLSVEYNQRRVLTHNDKLDLSKMLGVMQFVLLFRSKRLRDCLIGAPELNFRIRELASVKRHRILEFPF